MQPIPIAKPLIGEAEKAAVMRILDSGQLVQGAEVARFEELFAAYCGVKHAIATTNGTTALTVALLACGVGAGDEVIIPSFSFVATATSVLGAGAVPVFVDIEPDTFGINPAAIEAAITPRTKAIMPVHLYGHPADMPAINAIAARHGLTVIADSAQAHGAAINGQRTGSLAKAAAFSFYPSKNMTTGEGGMVTTSDDDVAARARMIRNHGMNTQYYHEMVGFNFRMTNLCAAIGVVQMDRIEAWTEQRIENADFLTEGIKTVRPPITRHGCRHVFHQYTVIAPEGADRDAMVARLNERGIGTRVYYPLPIHRQPVFRQMGYEGLSLPVTEALTARVFSLPVHPSLSREDLERIVAEVNAL